MTEMSIGDWIQVGVVVSAVAALIVSLVMGDLRREWHAEPFNGGLWPGQHTKGVVQT